MSRIHAVTPEGRLNEGMTLAVTAILAGIALGSAAAGTLIDHLGPTTPYALPAAAALLALIVSQTVRLSGTSQVP